MKKIVTFLLIIAFFTTIVAEKVNDDFKAKFELSGMKLRSALEQKIPGKKLGLLPFLTKDNIKAFLLSDIYAHYLKESNFSLIDRKNMKKVMEEIKLEMMGITEPKNMEKLGSMSGSDYLLTGAMSTLQDKVVVTVKALDVGTGEAIYSDTFNFQSGEFISLKTVEGYFAEKKYPVSAMFRSMLIPGWGQFYNDAPVRGVIYPVLVAAGAATTIYFGVNWKKDLTDYGPGHEAEMQQELDDREKAKNGFAVALSATLTAWLINSLDALIDAKLKKN